MQHKPIKNTHPSSEMDARRHFRFLSRQVLKSIDNAEYHAQRIRVANELPSSEPVQGALADYFYGCWFQIGFDDAIESQRLLSEAREKLNPQVLNEFQKFIDRKAYAEQISVLATDWSVLVKPSMDVPLFRLRTSKQNTIHVVDTFLNQLIEADVSNDREAVSNIEQSFFDHCLVCNDLMAFMKVWFRLNKKGWKFDERWSECRSKLEKVR